MQQRRHMCAVAQRIYMHIKLRKYKVGVHNYYEGAVALGEKRVPLWEVRADLD